MTVSTIRDATLAQLRELLHSASVLLDERKWSGDFQGPRPTEGPDDIGHLSPLAARIEVLALRRRVHPDEPETARILDEAEEALRRLCVLDAQPAAAAAGDEPSAARCCVGLQEVLTALAKSPAHRLRFETADDEFYLDDRETTRRNLASAREDLLKWKANVSDCDKFAAFQYGAYGLHCLRNGCCFVLDYSGGHSYHLALYVDADNSVQVEVWEPQEEDFVAPDRVGKKPYVMRQGIIVV